MSDIAASQLSCCPSNCLTPRCHPAAASHPPSCCLPPTQLLPAIHLAAACYPPSRCLPPTHKLNSLFAPCDRPPPARALDNQSNTLFAPFCGKKNSNNKTRRTYCGDKGYCGAHCWKVEERGKREEVQKIKGKLAAEVAWGPGLFRPGCQKQRCKDKGWSVFHTLSPNNTHVLT